MKFCSETYLGKTYRRGEYNCAHFAAEVWADLTGQDIKPMLCGLLPDTGPTSISSLRRFVRIDTPVDPCLVLYTHPVLRPHAGIFVAGRVLHLSERGVQYAPVDMAGQGRAPRFYLC